MAKLSRFRTDTQAVQDGEWVRLGAEFDDLEIRTRGFTDRYTDAQANRQRRAATSYGGDPTRIPVAIRRSINVDCLIDFCLIEVRNLTEDDGVTPIPFERFCDLLRDPAYAEMVEACYRAVNQVGKQASLNVEDALGNSVPASSTA